MTSPVLPLPHSDYHEEVSALRAKIEQFAERDRTLFAQSLSDLAAAQAYEIDRLNSVINDTRHVPELALVQIAPFGSGLAALDSAGRCWVYDGAAWSRMADLPSASELAARARAADAEAARRDQIRRITAETAASGRLPPELRAVKG